ncbi:hypothetical protein NW761_005389 [Fusarium oxysporum]|nr:hypothetical protein NW758_004797 [Fusarium oxysporum]KAJ4094930.1 hypothetical protein NW761_005389 [Fusarium oxysporum]
MPRIDDLLVLLEVFFASEKVGLPGGTATKAELDFAEKDSPVKGEDVKPGPWPGGLPPDSVRDDGSAAVAGASLSSSPPLSSDNFRPEMRVVHIAYLHAIRLQTSGAFSALLWPNSSTHFDFDLPSAPPFRTSRLVGLGSIRRHHFTYLDRQPHVQTREKSVIAPSPGFTSTLKVLSHRLRPTPRSSFTARLRLSFEGAISSASPYLTSYTSPLRALCRLRSDLAKISTRLTSFASPIRTLLYDADSGRYEVFGCYADDMVVRIVEILAQDGNNE